jgi:hypothetical protein
VDQLVRSVSRSIGGGLALHQIVNASGELLAGEWRGLQSLGKLIAKEITAYTPAFYQAMGKLDDELAEIIPTLTHAVDTLAAIEKRLLELTGVEASSPDGVSSAAEELQALRDRVGKWNSDFREFSLHRNLGQTVASATATLRFIIGAIAIIKLGLEIAEQLNSKKPARQSASRASADA